LISQIIADFIYPHISVVSAGDDIEYYI